MAKKPSSGKKTESKQAESIKPTAPANEEKGLYTIPAHQPFLSSVAQGILDQVGNDPLKLSDYTILVPDHGTASALRQAFTEQLRGKISVMPCIGAPGDMDNERLSLQMSDNKVLSQALMDIPPAVSRLQRQMILAGEILKIPGMAGSASKAIKLGGELGKFLDEAQRHDVKLDLKDFEKLVPPEFEKQWSKTADFLKIITDIWPEKLKEMGRIDPEDHKNIVIRIQAARWLQDKPLRPVIAVGFNDESPVVGELLKAVADMPKGAIILQGLDLGLNQQDWDTVTPVHPQYALKNMLKALNADRAAVREWQADTAAADNFARSPNLSLTNAERQKLLRDAMRPADTHKKKTENKKPGSIDVSALSGMDMVTCGSQQEEASVIALKMRESLEVPGRKVTLVTADRSLARRVSARLRSWQISVPDAAGVPLSKTPVGVYLLATATMGAEEWAPVPALEALKHPLTAMGEKKEDFRRKVSDIEDLVFHGPRPGAGAEGVKGALAAAFNRAAKRSKPVANRKELETFLDGIEKAGKGFFDKMSAGGPKPFREFLDEHIRFAEALAADDKNSGADKIWRGDDGTRAARFLISLREAGAFMPDMSGKDYIDVLQGLMQDVTVHTTSTSHPSLKIMTPAQARLLKSDIVILGGINDEIWPRRADENPWLSPEMMGKLGFPPHDAPIGREAHSFVQMASNPNVFLTRALRSGDAPMVSSPFLVRLMMAINTAGLEGKIEQKTRLLDIHKAIHAPAHVTPIEPPHVTPPVSARPKKLPVTAIEALMRDPYSVYVKYVLKLHPKEGLDAHPSVAERGIFTHAALEAFVKKYPDELPDNAREELLKIGRETFENRMNSPSVRAFWWPRFERIADWFVKFEKNRRNVSKTLGTEVEGRLDIDLGDGVFTLTAIADRLDRDSDDRLSIIDYKTGSVPSQKSVAAGFSPQLTLEALIAFTGGFDGIDAADVGRLQYWKLSGGRPAAEVTDVKGDIKARAAEARNGVENLIRAFNDKKTPYLVTPRQEWAPRYNKTEHLSRAGEWSTVKKTGKRQPPPGKRSSKR